MRTSKSRNRSKSNRNNRTIGNITNRVFDSSGPEGKVRGTPQQIIDKYQQLTRDAQLSGDLVAVENFQQHAEHYMRMLSAAQKEQDARREVQERENRKKQAQRDAERAERQSAEIDEDTPQPDIQSEEGLTADQAEVPQEGSSESPRPKRRRRVVKPVETLAAAPEAEEVDGMFVALD